MSATDDLDDLGEVSPVNDFELLFVATVSDPNSGAEIPMPSRGDGLFFIASTLDGPTIHASLSVALVPLAGRPGAFRGTIQGTDIATNLVLADGTVVFPIALFPGDRRRPYRATFRSPARS